MSRSHRNGKKCDRKEYESQYVIKQKVKNQCVKSQNVLESKIHQLEVDELIVKHQSGAPFEINESVTIVGKNIPLQPSCEGGFCNSNPPTPTPNTPSGGIFHLGKSFTGKVTFYGVDGMEFDLNGFVLNNDNDVTLEFINCNSVWVHGGVVNNTNGTGIQISCSSNVCVSRINTSNTENGFMIINSYDIQVKNIYMDNITGYVIRYDCSNYLRFTNLNINNISSYEDSLLAGTNSQMIFVSNCAFHNINVINVAGERRVMSFEQCFDVKVSHISILTTHFTGTTDSDLRVYIVHFKNSGSLIVGSCIIDGDSLTVSGSSQGVLNCLRLENCNNTFSAHHLMTDNFVRGDSSSTFLEFNAIHIDGMDTLTINSSKICTNYAVVSSKSTLVFVRSFYGAHGGNWYLSGNICNQDHIDIPDGANPSTYVNTSVIGYEVFDVSSSVVLQHCSSNNHRGPFEVRGFKIHLVDVLNPTNILINGSAANQNNSTGGSAIGFSSSYSNTILLNSESIANESKDNCYGFLIPGLYGGIQYTVLVFNCTGNNNLSLNGKSYGLYGGLLGNIETLLIKKSTFSSNGPLVGSMPANPGYGVYLKNINVSSLIGNYLNYNNWGLFVDGGKNHSIISNSAVYNDIGFQLKEAPNSIIQKNLAQNNTDAFIDNTTATELGTILNSYFTNNAVANTTSYENVAPSVVPWFKFNPSTGGFTAAGTAIGPILSTFTNTSS